MWLLKYHFRHRECKYLPMVKRLGITLYVYPINNFTSRNNFYVTAIHIVEGEKDKIKSYLEYLRKISVKVERISENSMFTLTVMRENLKYYKTLYSPLFIYPSPVIHDGEKEIGEIACWDEEPLRNLVRVMQKSKNTIFFKLLKLKNENLKEILLFRVMPNLTAKQREAFEMATKEGYYNYPRKINLGGLSELMRISKSNYHEILRRAESNILKFLPK